MFASALALAGTALGGITQWIGPDGGSFDAPRNWSDGVPGVSDTALFDTAGAFSVVVPSDAAADRLIVRSGAFGFSVASSLSGLSSSALTPSIGVADLPGSVASLALLDGVLFGGHGLVGGGAGALGGISVADDAALLLDSILVIGSGGHGSLSLAGDLIASGLEAGTSGSGIGEIMIGGGSATVGFTTIIGSFGSGTLDVADGGSLTTDELLVALNGLTTGSVTVTGAGTGISTIQKLRLAHGGNAELVIADGAVVTVGTDMNVAALPQSFIFPFFPSSFARIEMDGDGSRLDVLGILRLGVLGIAELEVGPGASVTVGDQMLVRNHVTTLVRLGIGAASANGDPIIDVVNAFAPGSTAYTVEIFIDPTDPPWVGDQYILIEGASLSLPDSIPLPTVPGRTLTSAVETVDGRERLVIDVAASADLDGDGIVDGSDLGILLSQWGPCPGCSGDLNGDGVVDGTDLGILLANWSTNP